MVFFQNCLRAAKCPFIVVMLILVCVTFCACNKERNGQELTSTEVDYSDSDTDIFPKELYELSSEYSSETLLLEKSREANCSLKKIQSAEAIAIVEKCIGSTDSCVEGTLPGGETALFDLERNIALTLDGSWYNFDGTKMPPCEKCGGTMGYGQDKCIGWCDVQINMAF